MYVVITVEVLSLCMAADLKKMYIDHMQVSYMLGPHKLSLQATVDHQRNSIQYVH